jgi:hypothetical protein
MKAQPAGKNGVPEPGRVLVLEKEALLILLGRSGGRGGSRGRAGDGSGWLVWADRLWEDLRPVEQDGIDWLYAVVVELAFLVEVCEDVKAGVEVGTHPDADLLSSDTPGNRDVSEAVLVRRTSRLRKDRGIKSKVEMDFKKWVYRGTQAKAPDEYIVILHSFKTRSGQSGFL